MSCYPVEPGFRRSDISGLSRAAAETVAPTLGKMLNRVEDYLRANGPASPEEIAAAIARPGEHVLLNSVRARVTQLRRLGRVVDSGERALGESGRCKVQRLRLTTPEEYADFITAKEAADEQG